MNDYNNNFCLGDSIAIDTLRILVVLWKAAWYVFGALAVLLFNHIILLDGILSGIACGVCAYSFLALHPALCVLIALAFGAAMYFVQQTRIGFWVFSSLFSLAWALITACVVFLFRGKDTLWLALSAVFALAISIWLHIRARNRKQSMAESAAEENSSIIHKKPKGTVTYDTIRY